jgi:hypothetical protein
LCHISLEIGMIDTAASPGRRCDTLQAETMSM